MICLVKNSVTQVPKNTNMLYSSEEANPINLNSYVQINTCNRVATFADFIPEKWKSGEIEIASGNVENLGKLAKVQKNVYF